MAKWQFTKGLHDIGNGCHAYLQPDGGWGWSNAGLITDGDRSLLVDTLFDLKLTREMLDAMRDAVPAAKSIGTLVNTHSNGDHTFGNQLVGGAEIVTTKACAEEMLERPPEALAAMIRNRDSARRRRQVPLRDDGPALRMGRRGLHRADPHFRPASSTSRSATSRSSSSSSARRIPAATCWSICRSDRIVFTGDLLFINGHPVIWAGPSELDQGLRHDPRLGRRYRRAGPRADHRQGGCREVQGLFRIHRSRIAGISSQTSARCSSACSRASTPRWARCGWSLPHRPRRATATPPPALDGAAAAPPHLMRSRRRGRHASARGAARRGRPATRRSTSCTAKAWASVPLRATSAATSAPCRKYPAASSCPHPWAAPEPPACHHPLPALLARALGGGRAPRPRLPRRAAARPRSAGPLAPGGARGPADRRRAGPAATAAAGGQAVRPAPGRRLARARAGGV